jgi:hypothetical protein
MKTTRQNGDPTPDVSCSPTATNAGVQLVGHTVSIDSTRSPSAATPAMTTPITTIRRPRKTHAEEKIAVPMVMTASPRMLIYMLNNIRAIVVRSEVVAIATNNLKQPDK